MENAEGKGTPSYFLLMRSGCHKFEPADTKGSEIVRQIQRQNGEGNQPAGASLFYPPLKLIIGSVTTSIAITVGGVALTILPSLMAGNELLIFGGVAAAVGIWLFAHRHGKLQGLVDANKNGIDDRSEAPTKSTAV